MKYFIHNLELETVEQVSEGFMRSTLGGSLFDALCESGSLSCGTTIYEAQSK